MRRATSSDRLARGALDRRGRTAGGTEARAPPHSRASCRSEPERVSARPPHRRASALTGQERIGSPGRGADQGLVRPSKGREDSATRPRLLLPPEWARSRRRALGVPRRAPPERPPSVRPSAWSSPAVGAPDLGRRFARRRAYATLWRPRLRRARNRGGGCLAAGSRYQPARTSGPVRRRPCRAAALIAGSNRGHRGLEATAARLLEKLGARLAGNCSLLHGQVR